MTEYTNQTMLFKEISHKKVHVDFNGGQISSDAGVILLREIADRIGLFKRFSSVLPDRRHPGYVQHDISRLLTQRVFQIACGYEDGNDSNELRKDPIFKLGCGRLPDSEDLLASQPTMSRFENAPSRTTLYRIAQTFVDVFCDSYKKEPEAVILDIDDTDDPTHGSQQLSLFNAYYDPYCYQPIHIFEGVSGKLITSILRPGKRPSGLQAASILKRVHGRIRKNWRHTNILFRGDSHYCAPKVLEMCESHNMTFVLGLKANKILLEKAATLMTQAQELYELKKQPVKIYGEFRYKAGSWKNTYRVIVKAEYNDKGPNTRFIVTNLLGAYRKFVYEDVYCGRGSMELMIKELKNHLHSDRTSCSTFAANQFRLFLHSMAYVLLHNLREKHLAGTDLAEAQFDTIRIRLLKIGAIVVEKITKIKIHLSGGYPSKELFCRLYESCCSP